MGELRDCGASQFSEPYHCSSAAEARSRHRRSSLPATISASASSKICALDKYPSRRSSAFLEVGLGGEDCLVDAKIRRSLRPRQQVRFRSTVDVHEVERSQWPTEMDECLARYPIVQRPPLPATFPTLPRLMLLACIFLLGMHTWNDSSFFKAGLSPVGATAGPVKRTKEADVVSLPTTALRRADSPTDVCVRWSGQSAVVNGTLYYYGGRSSTQPGQSQNTWNNNFLSLDVSKSWQISTPRIQGLAQPSGPPAVANGYLWNSYEALYLYGGEFSDSPVASPFPFSTWSYDIASSSWEEHSNAQQSPGTNSDSGNAPVQRAAEGAGITIPSLGRGYYFGGHLDGYTTAGWSQSIAREYLTSLLEYTFPGYSNSAVQSDPNAGPDGIYRNITQGGLQDTAGFPERADGVLVYVPGLGKQGIIIGLAGGNNASFAQMNVIDVYDIATSEWYKQATTGPTPPIRVNPCAVAASAADGSSVQVYMYGGQNLIPYGSQTQYSDVWILTIPSFTWISVDTSTQSVPYARAGHTCNVWNGQMVVVGGYVGDELECDSPGIYVFNLSALSWQNQYTALEGGNVLNQQKSQERDPSALQGSYGYEVPRQVQSVIGGSALGGATVTSPAQSAAQGPLATAVPKTYTVTQSGGAVVTETSSPSSGGAGSGSGKPNSGGTQDLSNGNGSNTGAIIAGVLAGCFALLAAYLGFCAWVYRRQLKLYKNHVAMAQRAQLAGDTRYIGAGELLVPGTFSDSLKSKSRDSDEHSGGPRSSGGNNSAPRGYKRVPLPLGTNNPYRGLGSARSSTDDLMRGQEPSYLGVLLNPRRSLRVVNRD